jgi:hypothetical protein
MAGVAHIDPPWEKFPETEPWWGGWRQGVSEAWLHDEWLPFWRAKTESERVAYLQAFPPPTDLWRTYLMEYWVR